MTDVADFGDVAMEPGTLDGALTRLERRGWIRPLDSDDRRRPYEITAAGRTVLAEQLARVVLGGTDAGPLLSAPVAPALRRRTVGSSRSAPHRTPDRT